MKINRLLELGSNPITKRFYWVIFGILFYISGESFLIWLLEPENFSGDNKWFLVAIFPLIAPLSFYINKKLGCAACQAGSCSIETDPTMKNNNDFLIGTGQMP